MEKLNLPDFKFKIIEKNGKKYIFDKIRKKYVQLTPEEWVRQNIVSYLTEKLNYPQHLTGIEKQINVFGTKKRPDVVIFDKTFKPKVIVECKQPAVAITGETMKQAINYFLELRPEYFLLTNGLTHYFCKIQQNQCKFLNEILPFEKL